MYNSGSMADGYPGLVPFTVHRIRRTAPLWCNFNALAAAGEEGWDAETFAKRFSYAIRNSRSFTTIDFDEQDSLVAYAERYGGFGTGSHGGGARAGNIGPYQLKGIGRNPLAAPPEKTLNGEFHGFGGFPLVDAICETINSALYGRLLPLGTVTCYGLILSGEKTAFYPQRIDTEPSAGAILVRERCVRPAHFLRCRFYSIPAELLLTVGSDTGRTRQVCKALRTELGGDRGFAAYLGDFLMSCANQFAFARLWRINHGSVSASNLSVDGRWLDLMGSSFLGPRMDYTPNPNIPPFSREADQAKTIVKEWADTYAKYCRTNIAPEPLLAYYDDQLAAYLHYYIPTFFGIEAGSVASFGGTEHASLLVEKVTAALRSDLKLTGALPQCSDPAKDPAASLAEGLFASSEGSADPLSPGLRTAFSALTDAAFENRPVRAVGRLSFQCLLAARCLKRLYFSSFFFRGRLIGQASAVTLSGDRSAVGTMIEEWLAKAGWIFEPADAPSQTLVDHAGVRLSYGADGRFELREQGRSETYTGAEGIALLRARLANLPPERLRTSACFAFPPVAAYDFLPGALRLLGVLEKLYRNGAAGAS